MGPTPGFLPGASPGQRSPWGHKELETTEQITLTFLLFFLNGNNIYCRLM